MPSLTIRASSGRRSIFGRAIASGNRFSALGDAAQDPSIVRSFDTAHIRRQTRLDPLPSHIAEPKQVLAHD
jgi:hypothetical protein